MKKIDIKSAFSPIIATMVENYMRDGYLAPVLFILDNKNQLFISLIENEYLKPDNRFAFSQHLRALAKEPSIVAIGITLEAYITKEGVKQEELNTVLKGKKRLSELDCKEDAILFSVSSRIGDNILRIFPVDPENRLVKQERKFPDNTIMEGIFHNFFEVFNS